MTITAKLVHLSTERRRRRYTPPDPLKVALMESVILEQIADLDRLWAADAAQLIEASQIGGAEQ